MNNGITMVMPRKQTGSSCNPTVDRWTFAAYNLILDLGCHC